MLTLGQAATEAGVSKATISRAIASGRLSAARSDTRKSFAIDPAELFRVFPPNTGNGAEKRTATPDETAESTLSIELEALRAQLATMRELADDLKSQRDAWQRQAEASQRQAEASQRLLVDQRKPPEGRRWFGLLKAS